MLLVVFVKFNPANGDDKFSLIKCMDLVMRFFILNLGSSPNRLCSRCMDIFIVLFNRCAPWNSLEFQPMCSLLFY
jgi:hypothetical protein